MIVCWFWSGVIWKITRLECSCRQWTRGGNSAWQRSRVEQGTHQRRCESRIVTWQASECKAYHLHHCPKVHLGKNANTFWPLIHPWMGIQIEDVLLAEFTYFAFTCIPGDSFYKQRSQLYPLLTHLLDPLLTCVLHPLLTCMTSVRH